MSVVDNVNAALGRDALQLLQVEECDAWYEYLASTQEQHDTRYDEVEPWAWNKLQTKVRAIGLRRRKLAPA